MRRTIAGLMVAAALAPSAQAQTPQKVVDIPTSLLEGS